MLANTVEGINEFKISMRRKEYRKKSIPETLKHKLRVLDNLDWNANIDTRSYLHPLDNALNNPDLVGTDLLVRYITTLSEIMINVGGGKMFLGYMDKVIEYYTKSQLPVCELYLVKAEYLSLLSIEDEEREKAIDLAMKHAITEKDNLKTLIDLARYYQASSQYKKVVETCEYCLQIIHANQQFNIHLLRVWAILGMNYFYQFDFGNSKKYFEAVIEKRGVYPDNYNVQTAWHYLGRIHAANGDIKKALDYYVYALQQLEKHFPHKREAMAFAHLRIGEILLSVHLFEQARFHLNESQQLFLMTQSDSTSVTHLDLAWADLYIQEEKLVEAEKRIEKAIVHATERGFPRGELMGLEKLFWFQLRRFRIQSVIYTLFRAMKTWRKGEMNRNGGFRLLAIYLKSIPVILLRSIQGFSYSLHLQETTKNSREVINCVCSVHIKRKENSV